MKKITLFLVCMVFSQFALMAQDTTPINEFASGRAKVVKIDNTQAWTATGVTVQVGDTITMLVRGIASPNGLAVPSTIFWVGPEGWGGGSGGPVPTAANCSVVGRIGASGTPFYVVSSCHLRVLTAGQLYLGMNDNIASDNAGFYLAHIYYDNNSRR